MLEVGTVSLTASVLYLYSNASAAHGLVTTSTLCCSYMYEPRTHPVVRAVPKIAIIHCPMIDPYEARGVWGPL